MKLLGRRSLVRDNLSRSGYADEIIFLKKIKTTMRDAISANCSFDKAILRAKCPNSKTNCLKVVETFGSSHDRGAN